MKLAITGKGGVGKTTLAAGIAQRWAEEGRAVLAVDADPTNSLAAALGFPPDLSAQIVPLSERHDLIEERTGAKPGTVGGFFRLNPKVDDLAERLAVAHRGVRLAVMGTISLGGSGCACAENTLLRSFLAHLFVGPEERVVVDMEGGIEHLGRRTAEKVSAMVAVVEPSSQSCAVARKIIKLAGDIGQHRVLIVGNRIRSAEEEALLRSFFPAEQLLGFLPYDEAVRLTELKGEAPYEGSPLFRERIAALVGQLELRLG
ncbi:MAG: AAA family ATPase [Candidatus Tectomicrobia bacterium]|uniref:AAA family ATPase n=1 Tax=Tectimicrobiota bacterium TaxID=2528274 RepID=A0A932CPC6_UNCTE|nr:AAA family ATPase [Candidatus Tectomicrobia bacterium]